jgi:hypothetical protein
LVRGRRIAGLAPPAQLPGAPTPSDDYEKLSSVLAGLSRDRIRKLKEQSRNRWQASWKGRARENNIEILKKLANEGERVARERIAKAQGIGTTLDRILGNQAGERARAVGYVDQYKTGQRLAVANALPPVQDLKTRDQRKNANQLVGQALERAREAIDQNGNEILIGLVEEADLVLEPISVRELAALEAPLDTDIEHKEDVAETIGGVIGAGLGVALVVGLSFLSFGAAIPLIPRAAKAGADLGRNLAAPR